MPSQPPMITPGIRATVMGLGRHGGGLAAVRFLAERGCRVTISDAAPRTALDNSIRALRDVPIDAIHVGGHQSRDFSDADLLVVNPAVPPLHPMVDLATDSGAAVTSEIELFINECRGHMVAITGSNGKSTTASMLHAILQHEGRSCWLGGNIGGSLLGELSRIDPQDWVVLELSSFQLQRLSSSSRAWDLAAVTNVAPNHLDWHGSYEDYVRAKQRIVTHPSFRGRAALNPADPQLANWANFLRDDPLPVDADERLQLKVCGEHNRRNAALAATLARHIGCRADAISSGLGSFCGLPQRLQHVGQVGGRTFINDSAATTPESVVAAVRGLPRGPWLLMGGKDKGCDFQPLVEVVARRARGVALYGAVAESLALRFSRFDDNFPCQGVATMQDALHWCWDRSRDGDTILLSPGCSSQDQFADSVERGQVFEQSVATLAAAPSRTTEALGANASRRLL